MDEPPHDAGRHSECRRICLRTGASQIRRAVAPGCANRRARRRQLECTPERGGSAGYALVFKRQQRRLQQVFVRIVQRHPAIELGPATHGDQPIAVDRGWPHVGVARAGAGAMGEHETAQVSVDTRHHVASSSTGTKVTRPSSSASAAKLLSTVLWYRGTTDGPTLGSAALRRSRWGQPIAHVPERDRERDYEGAGARRPAPDGAGPERKPTSKCVTCWWASTRGRPLQGRGPHRRESGSSRRYDRPLIARYHTDVSRTIANTASREKLQITVRKPARLNPRATETTARWTIRLANSGPTHPMDSMYSQAASAGRETARRPTAGRLDAASEAITASMVAAVKAR